MGKGMKAGKRPKAPGAGNMQKQMQQMQQMQRKMDELQAEINEMEATATSGGGKKRNQGHSDQTGSYRS